MLEHGPGRQPDGEMSISRSFYEASLVAAEGDATEAVNAIRTEAEAWAWATGHMDRLAEEGVEPQALHRFTSADVHQRLKDGSEGDITVLTDKHALWRPVFDAIKLRGELAERGVKWETVRGAVHFLDKLGVEFLMSGPGSETS